MFKNCRIIAAALLSLILATAGCSSSSEAPKSTAETEPAPVSAAPPAAIQTEPKSPTAAAKEPELADPKAATAQVAEFTPPFPDRIDLFEPAKRESSASRRDDEHGETVELKGFINVDTPRVVLSIDGVISAIPEGGEKYGVHVISIKPPTVLLQRGRDRWPATLE